MGKVSVGCEAAGEERGRRRQRFKVGREGSKEGKEGVVGDGSEDEGKKRDNYLQSQLYYT